MKHPLPVTRHRTATELLIIRSKHAGQLSRIELDQWKINTKAAKAPTETNPAAITANRNKTVIPHPRTVTQSWGGSHACCAKAGEK
jgi:hypothetical protein